MRRRVRANAQVFHALQGGWQVMGGLVVLLLLLVGAALGAPACRMQQFLSLVRAVAVGKRAVTQ